MVLFGSLTFIACNEVEKTAPCVSDFYYEGSPFRQGAEGTLMPSYQSGQDVQGVFTSNPGLVIIDSLTGEIDLEASVPGSYTIRKTMIGNPTCGNRIVQQYISILPPPQILANGDDANGWGWSGNGFIDTEDRKEGGGSVKNTSNDANLLLLQYQPSLPLTTGVNKEFGQMHLWFYISDLSQFNDFTEIGQFEISSSGGPDQEEFTWPIIIGNMGLVTGWNEMIFKFNDAAITGGNPDLSAINFFRVYLFAKDGASYPVTIGLDDIKILAEE